MLLPDLPGKVVALTAAAPRLCESSSSAARLSRAAVRGWRPFSLRARTVLAETRIQSISRTLRVTPVRATFLPWLGPPSTYGHSLRPERGVTNMNVDRVEHSLVHSDDGLGRCGLVGSPCPVPISQNERPSGQKDRGKPTFKSPSGPLTVLSPSGNRRPSVEEKKQRPSARQGLERRSRCRGIRLVLRINVPPQPGDVTWVACPHPSVHRRPSPGIAGERPIDRPTGLG